MVLNSVLYKTATAFGTKKSHHRLRDHSAAQRIID